MNDFPLYQAPYIGNGMVIGANAVLHVFISHGLAIGAFAMIAFADAALVRGYLEPDKHWDAFLHRFLKFTVIVVTVVGAVTGAGIWFTTNSLAARASASLLHMFFWPWFVEYIVFILEAALLLYYYLYWDSFSKFARGWMVLPYFGLVLSSAVLITGILGFMLTPGDWPLTGSFTSAYFNPSFLPQLATRILFALAIGELLAIAFVLPFRSATRFTAAALKLFGLWLALTLPALVVAAWAYYYSVPYGSSTWTGFAILTSDLSQHAWLMTLGNILGIALVVGVAAAALRGWVRMVAALIFPALVYSFLFVAQFERIREFIRGPYLMPGYMFANTLLLEEEPYFRSTSTLRNSYWYERSPGGDSVYEAGAYLFGLNCSGCHTIGGLNDINRRVAGRTEDGLYVIISRVHEMVPFMPPFSGNETEQRIMARFLYQLNAGKVAMQSNARFQPRTEEK